MAGKGITPEQAQKIRKANGIEETKLQRLRVKKGLSQSNLSVVTAVPIRTIRSYEQKTRPIEGARLDVLCALCIALDCKIEDILEDKTLIEKYRLVK